MKRIAAFVIAGTILGIVLSYLFLLIDWFPPKASEEAGPIDSLFWWITYISFIIFGWVMAGMSYCLWKFRRHGASDMRDGSHIHGNTALEIFWTAIPLAIVLGLGTWGWLVLNDNEASAANPVKVTAKLYSFNFDYLYSAKGGFVPDDGKYVSRYPDSFTSSMLVLPVDRQLLLRVRTADKQADGELEVVHGFWVAEWGVKRDATPGIRGDGEATIKVIPNKLGTYQVQCTELCGSGHSIMFNPAGVRVVSQADYDTWFAEQLAKAKTDAAAAAGNKGLAVFKTGGCGGCHAFTPAGSNGAVGPSLDDVSADAAAAGKPLDAFIRESIVNPGAYTAKGFAQGMPGTYAQTIKGADLDELVKYLAKGGSQ